MVPGWFNDNKNRTYPFVDQDDGLPFPNSAIVDFGCLITQNVTFGEQDVVYLDNIFRNPSYFVFSFRITSPEFGGRKLVFTVPSNADDYLTTRSGSDVGDSSSSESISSPDCPYYPEWEGYLVTGTMADLRDVLSIGSTIYGSQERSPVEPALVQNLGHSLVRSINLANKERTKATAPQDCPEYDPVDTEHNYVSARCLYGDVKFREGYNCSIRQSASTNSLQFSGGVGAGAGEAFDEVPLYPGEVPEGGQMLLTRGPRCEDTVKTINGVGGAHLNLDEGLGVSIYPGSEEGQLIIDFDLLGTTMCPSSSEGGG